MKFDIAPSPDPLTFGEGDEAFTLSLRPLDGEERGAIIDAVRDGSIVKIQYAVEQMVIGWDGVIDEGRNPVPFQYKDRGITKNRFSAFLGALSCKMQLVVIIGLLAFVGIPTGDIDQVVKAFGDTEDPPNTAPTEPPDSATPTNASGG